MQIALLAAQNDVSIPRKESYTHNILYSEMLDSLATGFKRPDFDAFGGRAYRHAVIGRDIQGPDNRLMRDFGVALDLGAIHLVFLTLQDQLQIERVVALEGVEQVRHLL